MDGDACRLDLLDQIEQSVGGIQVRRHFRDLRADMEIDTHHPQAGERGGRW